MLTHLEHTLGLKKLAVAESKDTYWAKMPTNTNPVFTKPLLEELVAFYNVDNLTPWPLFKVLSSSDPEVFNLGGDLDFFVKQIKSNNKKLLHDYANLSINLIHKINTAIYERTTSITLVQGQAFGGGMECALSANIVIAEEQATFCFPEVNYNLYPSMGGFSILSRKLCMNKLQELLTSADIYSAEHLYELGLIDVLVAKGQGEQAVRDYIKHQRAENNLYGKIEQIEDLTPKITLSELKWLVNDWVDALLDINNDDLLAMKRFLSAQQRRHSPVHSKAV